MPLLAINKIKLDGGTQSRDQLDIETIKAYAIDMVEGATFPPVVVFYDGTDYWLADGFHRVKAYTLAERLEADADVRQGTRRDAILYSVGANNSHGLRRSNADKRRAVTTLLNDSEWAGWSDREISRRCAVCHQMVSPLRRELTGRDDQSERTYTTRHGTTATMSTGNIGRTSASAELAAIAANRASEDAAELALRAEAIAEGDGDDDFDDEPQPTGATPHLNDVADPAATSTPSKKMNGNTILTRKNQAGRKAPEAVRGAIGTLVGLASGLDSFTAADAAPTPNEIAEWDKDLRKVLGSIKRFRRQLKEIAHV